MSEIQATIIKTEGSLDEQHKSLYDAFVAHQIETTKNFQNIKKQIRHADAIAKQEASALRSQIEQLRQDVYEVSVGSIQSKLFGVFLIGYGIYTGLS